MLRSGLFASTTVAPTPFLPIQPEPFGSFFAVPIQFGINQSIQKQPFTLTEDEAVIQFVREHGPKNWTQISSHLDHRTPKECRERWHNHLDPTIMRGPWSDEEDLILAQKQTVLGNKWAEIAAFLPGRNETLIKNRWNTSVKPRVAVDVGGNVSVLPHAIRTLPDDFCPISQADGEQLDWIDDCHTRPGLARMWRYGAIARFGDFE
jgi:hypothetical protein